MSLKKGRKVSRKVAKRYFSHVGAFILLYTLAVLIVPYFFHVLIKETSSSFVNDRILYFGIYFIIILFGTIIPFSLLRVYAKIPAKKFVKSANISFVDVFVEAIVCFVITILLTYVSNIALSHIGIGNKLISSIGFSYEDAYLNHWLYVFMLVVVTPIIEEYAFRGVLLSVLGKYGKFFGIISSSLFFALAHLHFAEMLPAFAMGYFLCCTTLRYRNIVPSIVIHIIFNLFIYGLCVLPSSISQYMAIGLVLVFALAVFFVLSGRYQRVVIQTLRNSRKTNRLFYTRPTIFITILLMILHTVFFTIGFLN